MPESSEATDTEATDSDAVIRRPAGGLEAAVLAALWAAGRPLTPREVQQAVAGSSPSGVPLARTTVTTILSRLHDKGTVSRSRAGRAYAYRPAVEDHAALAAQRMHSELDKERDRSTVLARFVSRLSSDDEELLRGLLARAAAPGEGTTGSGPPR
ncbi:BlaI/MecI/CopY family transcriptional regulator [Streptomyces gamaensis]|uniref:BlaI/MecI/CopY family transcriptional regulator n=1 Tax=Streptomyces gamaensis TaxID=1763542 RepID=A0ABW0Z0Q0_9ACTN